MDKNFKIGIVGLGLIGGSIFKGLCAKNYDVMAIVRSDETFEKVKKYSPNVSKSLSDLSDCDIVFVCTHMNQTEEMLDKLESVLSNETIVADVCSLKKFISQKHRPYKFIPSHPMAGTEFSGFDNSFEELFNGAKWVITPLAETQTFDVEKLSEIIETIGATPILATPQEHDEAVALISHMPMLISQALFKTAEPNQLALKLASSGFRDMTRLALSNEEMADDMINLNSQNIQNSLLKLYSSIGELLQGDYQGQISKIKQNREKMYENGKNIL